MNEPDIAPLARRLAEENNVDWRRLEGTGDGGRIVERDVLGYLARVMAGDEDLDPTPEPVPEGMQAWPEADVAAYRAARAAPPPPAERSVTSTLDDDLFLFDEPAPTAAVPAPVFAADEASPVHAAAVDDEGDDLLLVDEAPAGAATETEAVADAPIPSDDDGVVFLTDDVGADARSEAPADLPDLFEDGSATGAATGGFDDVTLVASEDEPDAPVPSVAVRSSALDEPLFVPDDGSTAAVDAVETAATPMGEAVRDEIADHASVAAEPAAAPAPVDLAAADVRLVRHGQVWRRRVDDRAFRSAVSHVADALEAPPTAVATALLARAVAKAWSGSVALDGWWWDGGDVHRRPVATDGAIADVVAALAASGGADGDGGAAALVVADLAALGMDEAVLHLDVPLLAIGRSVGDGAWLTLSGDDVASEAVSALGRVAEALAAPIRLLL